MGVALLQGGNVRSKYSHNPDLQEKMCKVSWALLFLEVWEGQGC